MSQPTIMVNLKSCSTPLSCHLPRLLYSIPPPPLSLLLALSPQNNPFILKMVFISFFPFSVSTPSPPPYAISPIPPCSNDQMHFLDFLCSSPYYPGANVLNSIATIHIQANLLSGFFKSSSPNTSFGERICGAEIKALGSPYTARNHPTPKQHCVSLIYSQRRSRQYTSNSSTFIKHQGKWSQKRNAHLEAHTFTNRLPLAVT